MNARRGPTPPRGMPRGALNRGGGGYRDATRERERERDESAMPTHLGVPLAGATAVPVTYVPDELTPSRSLSSRPFFPLPEVSLPALESRPRRPNPNPDPMSIVHPTVLVDHRGRTTISRESKTCQVPPEKSPPESPATCSHPAPRGEPGSVRGLRADRPLPAASRAQCGACARIARSTSRPRAVSVHAFGSPRPGRGISFAISPRCSRRRKSFDICPWSATPEASAT
jgi:hypothetical protein